MTRLAGSGVDAEDGGDLRSELPESPTRCPAVRPAGAHLIADGAAKSCRARRVAAGLKYSPAGGPALYRLEIPAATLTVANYETRMVPVDGAAMAQDKFSDVARDTGINRGTPTRLYHETAERIEFEVLDKLCEYLARGGRDRRVGARDT